MLTFTRLNFLSVFEAYKMCINVLHCNYIQLAAWQAACPPW